MDVAGIGESPAPPNQPDHRLYALETCEDVRAALDWLQAQGHGRAVAIGLCCGAFIAFYSALRDPRIEGLVMANLQRFIWHEGDTLEVSLRRSYQSNRYYAAMARRPDTWRRLLRGDINARGILTALLRRAHKRVAMRVADWSGRLLRRGSARQTVVQGFRQLAARGAEVLLFYSASDGGLDELETYFGRDGRRLRRLEKIRLEILDGADHTFTARWARERFADRIEAHLHRVGKRGERRSTTPCAGTAGAKRPAQPDVPSARRHVA
jgi:pimeloyl-ACP methyl ester carboxylesterase